MEENEKIKRLVSQCSAIVNLLLKKGYLSESINQQKFERLKKLLSEQENKEDEERIQKNSKA